MMYYLESESTDACYNLALEQFVFDGLDRAHEYFMLWRNHNAIIVGRHQNTAAELDPVFVREHGINVVRRLSGGGAVYHDLGNVNFTFIVSAEGRKAFDFASFCRPVVSALAGLGVTARINGRNDMTIEGGKFSGNAQYRKRGRIMHHGTILFDSDLSVLGKALVVPKDKIESKGLKSVYSRVTNVRDHLSGPMSVEGFMAALTKAMFREYALQSYTLTPEDQERVMALRRGVYATWDWNYGASPAYSIRKERRVEGCGKIEAHLDVVKGVIASAAFFGDYFSGRDIMELADKLAGQKLESGALRAALAGVPVAEYFHNLDLDTFLDILTQ